MIGRMSDLPARVRLVIFDLDGVIYRGADAIPGAAELVGWLHGCGVVVRFATNNSTVTRAGYVERLGGMGIPTASDEIVTSTWATVEHLRIHAPEINTVLAIGADGMREELIAAGLDVTMSDAAAAVHTGEALGPTLRRRHRRPRPALSTTAAWESPCGRSPTERA